MHVTNSPKMLSVFGAIEERLKSSNDRHAAVLFDENERLEWLIGRIGQLAQTVRKLHRHLLLDAAALTFAWLESKHINAGEVRILVSGERLRQRQLFSQGKLSFRVDGDIPSPSRKLHVLIEEVGEVAEAIEAIEMRPPQSQGRETPHRRTCPGRRRNRGLA